MDVYCQNSLVATVTLIIALVLLPRAGAAQVVRRDGDRVSNRDEIQLSRSLKPGFDLFGNRDFAAATSPQPGLRLTVTNIAPCGGSYLCDWQVVPGPGWNFPFFEIQLIAGAPPSAFRRILRVRPSIANAKGGGWTYLTGFAAFGGRTEWGPRDGSLGSLFSQERKLATSDDPVTWPTGGFGGDHPIHEQTWAWYLDQSASTGFDFWKLPDEFKDTTANLGDRFATYGETTDHFAEILADYGGVIPGRAGAPAIDGYPLGLVWHFEFFNFKRPGLENVNFWRATIVNRSADVYGTGIDYDSLYIGFQVGTMGVAATGGQRYSNYYLPGISAAVYHQSNVQGPGGPCGQAWRAQSGVSSCATGPGSGYNSGGNAIVVLKSPIGDLRNKLFSDPSSIFFDPANPLAGDTITFNHGHMCGFGGCYQNTIDVNDRRGFGLISSTAANVLDGRDPAMLTEKDAWRTFRNAAYPAVRGVFNHWVPGVEGPAAAGWDYNHDGLPDTLHFDTCHVAGCVAIDSDTMPGGQINAYGNVGGILAAGPFPLAAGDTTSWMVAFVGGTDSISAWQSIGQAIAAYMDFFPRPQSIPPPSIVSTQVIAPDTTPSVSSRTIKLIFDNRAERWVDPFLMHLADEIDSAPAGSFEAELKNLNPSLSNDLRKRAATNLDVLEIYKSCDNGQTFTATPDCLGDPAVDEQGNPIGLGWQVYATLQAHGEAGDRLPNTFIDSAVVAGRSYTYVLVTRSRGAQVPVITPTGTATLDFAPPLRSRLSTTGPQAVTVYAPLSREIGFAPATVTFDNKPRNGTSVFEVDLRPRPREARYTVVFGNTFVLNETIDNTGNRTAATVTVGRRLTALLRDVPRDTVLVHGTFPIASGTDGLLVSNLTADSQTVTPNGRTTEYSGVGFALLDPRQQVLFLQGTPLGSSTSPDGLIGDPNDPGFMIRTEVSPVPRFTRFIDMQGDTVRESPLGRVTWLDFSQPTYKGGGLYRIRWEDDPFGLAAPIALGSRDQASVEAELEAALENRKVASTARTDAAVQELTGVSLADLVPARLPFTIENVTFGRPVDVVMVRRARDSLDLSGSNRTLSVGIPSDIWVPGDYLYLVERVEDDSMVRGATVLLPSHAAVDRVFHDALTFDPAVIGCGTQSYGCDPVENAAEPYSVIAAGAITEFLYDTPFSPDDWFWFRVTPPVRGADASTIKQSDLDSVIVVPNPWVLGSGFQGGENSIMFTHVPPRGRIRIYTVSGQLVQQVSWTPDDLRGVGDLQVPLVTMFGEDMASGLYIWVLGASTDPADPSSKVIRKRGKFVVIR